MRITSGLLKNRALQSPQDSSVRPTSDKVRAAIFSSLADATEGAIFLDLFAGTGAVGIEAYSRGASHITFVDKNTNNLIKNVSLLPRDSFTVISSDLFKTKFTKKYDIIFIDPPYESYKPDEILKYIAEKNILAYNGVIVFEESARTDYDWQSSVFIMLRQRRYGDTIVTYLEQPDVSGDNE